MKNPRDAIGIGARTRTVNQPTAPPRTPF